MQLNAPDFYKTNPADARRINARFAEIDELLLVALERWELIEAPLNGRISHGRAMPEEDPMPEQHDASSCGRRARRR